MTWLIGIDLGTTNCTMACLSKEATLPEISQCSLSQSIALRMEGELFHLPSFLYIPLEEEGISLQVGAFARDRGKELPDRVIASAKSWLCHDGISRRSSFLPMGELEKKFSPVEVCSRFLGHLKKCWEERNPTIPFEKQTIFITVPASFDPSARQLVIEAAQQAGFPECTLIEEPLAAFYAWLYVKDKSWRQELKVGDVVLVVDCGGGTTDFSLIQVEENEGELSLSRQAVGEHLLLGGDNMDLALAYLAKEKFSQELDDWQFQALIHACREAKEVLLSEHPPSSVPIIIHGRGSSLIGGTLSAELTQKEVEAFLVNGFFPSVSYDEEILHEKRVGIAQLGLPFARDPRITAQLAAFLRKNGAPLPTAVLFNGGTMKAYPFRACLLSQLRAWGSAHIRELPDADLDFGVSKGAAYYGWTRQGKGIRVRADTCRSYYIGIESASPAVPGLPPPLQAVCLVPFGMEEGSEVTLGQQRFTLLLGEPAMFRFFSLSQPSLPSGEVPRVGSAVRRWREELKELHPIEAHLESQGEEGKYIEVSLKAKITEMGVLELWCVSPEGHRWKLEFDTRNKE